MYPNVPQNSTNRPKFNNLQVFFFDNLSLNLTFGLYNNIFKNIIIITLIKLIDRKCNNLQVFFFFTINHFQDIT